MSYYLNDNIKIEKIILNIELQMHGLNR